MKTTRRTFIANLGFLCQASAAGQGLPKGSASPEHGRDPALEPPPIYTSPSEEYSDKGRLFQGIPSIERSRGGRLWVLWYGGGKGEGPFNYVLAVTSGDDGTTWSKPKLVIDPCGLVRAFDPCLWHDPQGRLWAFWTQAIAHWDGRGGVWAINTTESDSSDPRWSTPRRIANGVMATKPTVLSTGEWLFPIAGWLSKPPDIVKVLERSLGRTPTDAVSMPKYGLSEDDIKSLTHDIGKEKGSNVYCSRDGGRALEWLGQARVPETDFDEHMLIERRDKTIWMLVRTGYGIGQSFSADRGVTWTNSGPSGIRHPNSRFFILRLRSGRLLLVKNNPPAPTPPPPEGIGWKGGGRSHLSAFLSDNEGETWYGNLLIDERAGVSYPDGTEAENGKIYIVYDHDREGAKEILMATFTEEDVHRGEPVTKKATFRCVVNKAGA